MGRTNNKKPKVTTTPDEMIASRMNLKRVGACRLLKGNCRSAYPARRQPKKLMIFAVMDVKVDPPINERT